jgi:signal transduction histidine kinase
VNESHAELDDVAIENARIQLIYQTFPTNLYTGFIVGPLIVFVMWPTTDKALLLGWFFSVMVAILARYWHGHLFMKKYEQTTGSLRPWAWLAMAHIALGGVMWGGIPILLLDIKSASLSQIIIAYFFSTFIMVGQSVTYCSYRPMWFAYAIPAGTLLIGHLLLDPNSNTNIWALAVLATIIFSFISLQQNSNSILESIKLKLQFAELMQQVQQEKHKADLASREKSMFLASASHDLRQPVHSMNLFIEVLKKKTLPEHSKMLVERIATCADGLRNLFNSLLDISNLDAGVVENKPNSINIQTLINSLVFQHNPEAKAKNIVLIADSPNIYVQTDKSILTRILSNLVSNAINHSAASEIKVCVECTGENVKLA